MFKKTLAIVLAIAMLASMWVMPASARTLNNYKIFSVDFSTGSADDAAGGITGTITEGKSLTYKTDDTIGRQVAEFDGTTALFYDIPVGTYLNLIQNFSVEAMVKVSKNAPWGWAQICGTYNYDSSGNGNDSGFALGTGGPWNSILGTGNAFSLSQGTTAGTDSTFGCGQYDTWSHLVYVHTTSTEALYLNGQLVSSRSVLQGDIPHDLSRGFRIGGYNLAQQFCAGMDIAYVNMYNTNVTAAEVGELYSLAFPSEATEAPVVTPKPTQAPTPSVADPIPSEYHFFGLDFSTGSDSDNIGGLAATITEGKTITYKNDSTIGRQVASFDGATALQYEFPVQNYVNMTQAFTMEAYVNVKNSAPWGWAQICGTYYYNNNSGIALGSNGPWNNALGTGNPFSITQGTTTETYNSFGCGSYNTWSHVVYVHSANTEYLYIDGELIASANSIQAQISHDTARYFRVGGYNLAQQFCGGMDIALINLYSKAATASEVTGLYNAAVGTGSVVTPTAAPTAKPTDTPVITPKPTAKPTPTPSTGDLVVPSGSDYTITASEVGPFKAGDEVRVRLTVDQINNGWSLMGLDWTVPYNAEALQLVEASCTSSSDIVNADYPNGDVKWELILNTTKAGQVGVTMLDDGDGWLGTSENGALWVELVFTALKDSTDDMYVLHTSFAEGTENVNLDVVKGTGVAVYVEGSQVVVTPKPTEKPVITPEPSEDPSIVLPVGEYYDLSANEIKPFKAGDEVRVRLTVSEIYDDWSLMGLDLKVPFDTNLLEYVSATSSADIINADYPDGEVKWELIMNTTKVDQGELRVTMLDDGDGWMGTSTDGAIWVELTFTAKADGNTGDYLLHTAEAVGTENVNLDEATGNGVAVYVAEGDAPVVTPKPTEEPVVTPEVTPTLEPTPECVTPTPTIEPVVTPSIDLPVGDFYELSANEIKPFKAGDEVRVRLTVSEIYDEWSLMGLDLTVPFDVNLLEYVSATSSSDIINADYPNGEVKWELIMNTTKADQGELRVTMLDDGDGWMGTSTDGAIWVELIFTAKADGNTGDYLLHTSEAVGTENVDLETATGNGVAVFVAEGDEPIVTPGPTDEPVVTPGPTDEPVVTPDPTEEPGLSVTGVGIIKKPNKTFYKIGEELDLTGLIALIKYSDGTSAEVGPEGVEIDASAYDNTKAGKYLISIIKGGKVAQFTVHVEEPAPIVVTGVGLLAKPTKLYYKSGESLNLDGLVALVKYSDGTIKYVDQSGITVDDSLFDNTQTGSYLISIVVDGKIAKFTVHVNVVTGVGIVTKPTKTTYAIGEELDLTGLVVMAKYADGSVKYMDKTTVEVDDSEFDNTKAGTYLITVTSGGKSAQFSVHVK